MSILLRRREGSIEILTLNRPEQRNALTPELMEELSSAFEQAQHADEVRVVVVTAAGDRAFCAGMDLKAFAAGPGDRVPRSTAYFEAFIEGRFPKPIIAAINATAVAGARVDDGMRSGSGFTGREVWSSRSEIWPVSRRLRCIASGKSSIGDCPRARADWRQHRC